MSDIVEMEKQIIYINKKIQLHRETSQALDPSVGQSEVAAMETEIHRMNIRLDSLKRERDRLIDQIERATERSGTISAQQQAKSQATKSRLGRDPLSKASIQKKVARLRAEVQSYNNDTEA